MNQEQQSQQSQQSLQTLELPLLFVDQYLPQLSRDGIGLYLTLLADLSRGKTIDMAYLLGAESSFWERLAFDRSQFSAALQELVDLGLLDRATLQPTELHPEEIEPECLRSEELQPERLRSEDIQPEDLHSEDLHSEDLQPKDPQLEVRTIEDPTKEQRLEADPGQASPPPQVVVTQASTQPQAAATPASTQPQAKRDELLDSVTKYYLGGQMSGQEYQDINGWFDNYGFDSSLVYSLFMTMSEATEALTLSRDTYLFQIYVLADYLHDQGIQTSEEAQKILDQIGPEMEFRSWLARKVQMTRPFTYYENKQVWAWHMAYQVPGKLEILDYALSKLNNIGDPSFSYVQGVLNNWEEAGLTTLTEIQAAEAAYQVSRHRSYPFDAKPGQQRVNRALASLTKLRKGIGNYEERNETSNNYQDLEANQKFFQVPAPSVLSGSSAPSASSPASVPSIPSGSSAPSAPNIPKEDS